MKTGYEKRFNNGDIVFFHRYIYNIPHPHFVEYGMVDEQFSDCVCIDLLEPKETRLVNGIPIDEFPDQTPWKKLPKGWTWNTRLYEVTNDTSDERMFEKYDLTDPACIKKLYDDGILVKSDTLFHGKIETEVTKEGYRILKRYPMWEPHPITHMSIQSNKVYFTYQEAQNEVDAIEKELQRQAALSDYDWSLEQIEHDINRLYSLTPDEKIAYKEWFCHRKNVEDIETRIFGGNLQWKYWKNKRWHNLCKADVLSKCWE